MNIKIDLNVCRVCLQANSGDNIYTGGILEKFQFTTLVQAVKNDGLPEILCKKCLVRLRIAYEFKKQAEASDRHIRSFILDVNKKFQQVTSSNKAPSTPKSELNDDGDNVGGNEAFDELDEEMQMLIYDEETSRSHTSITSKKYQASNVQKSVLKNQSLVDILGESLNEPNQSEIVDQDNLIDDSYDDPPQNMEVLILNEEEVELDPGYIVEHIDDDEFEAKTESTADEGVQFLDDEEEHLYELTEEPADCKTFFSKYQTGKSRRRSNDTNTKDNYCAKCNKQFSTRTNLTRHMLTHDGLKPYVCNICGNSFTQNGSLKSHMFIHTGERPYKCSECPKAFTQSKSLIFHLRRHTGEKPFICDICGLKFRQKDGLKRHEAARHSGKAPTLHPCEICGKVLLSKYSLSIHRNKHKLQDLSSHARNKEVKTKNLTDSRNTQKKEVSPRESACSDDPDVKDEEHNKSNDEAEEADDWDQVFTCEFCDETFSGPHALINHRESHPEIHNDNSKDNDSE